MDVRSCSNAPPLIEVLVHISGSSGARDDVRYRAQAAAYLNFEPYRSNALSPTKERATGDITLADTVSVGGIGKREALLGIFSDSVALGNAEKKDLQLWDTALEARNENSRLNIATGLLDPSSPSIEITAIQGDHGAPPPKVLAPSTVETLDQTSYALQSPARTTACTKALLDNQNDLSEEGVSPGIRRIQMNSSPPKYTTPPHLPSRAKRRRVESPNRPPQNGHTESGPSNTEHPCSHIFDIIKSETVQSLLNCGACKSGTLQYIYKCNDCMRSLCSSCYATYLRERKEQRAVITPTKQPPTPGKRPRECPPRRVPTLSPQKGRNENVPLFPKYACRHSYKHASAGSGSELVCTTCFDAVPDAFKCINCRSTLCQQCQNKYTDPLVRLSPPKPRLLAPKRPIPCASQPSPPQPLSPAHPLQPSPVIAPDHPPVPPPPLQVSRQQQHSSPSKLKPSRNGRSCTPLAPYSPPLEQLRNLPPTELSPPLLSSYPPSPSPPPFATEIHPPPPRTSSPNFLPPPLITASLSLLASKMPLQKYFSPAFVGRRLRPMERGYWRIPITAWEVGVKEQFWRFLEEYVGDGRAGWGVWVSRTVEMVNGSAVEKEGAVGVGVCEVRDSGAEAEIVRVYCWGEVVGYVWLVMIIASDRKARGSRCCWVDGGEQFVIRMA
ncbi:hypothetical protein FGG08_004571 [Glutinoglossum americanum]|uniref:Uncharacterized protein n=1 Tax=Glutinoglossum americanum TaxID=1670608 RepID=A0A9P8I8X9_9PEZI|nr:hypothetical protein FGG08_004571 [Glutinoglossum americanum]